MRHGRAGYRLTRKTAHRTAMLRNLAAGVFEHGQIVTTIPKAKAVQPFVEQIVTLAKQGDLAARRRAIAKLGGDRHGFEWLFIAKRASDEEKNHVNELRDRAKVFFDVPESKEVERNRYGELRSAPRLVKHIFDHVGPKFADRAGGYTRIVKLGKQRYGDNAELCVLQFVGAEEGPEIGGKPSTRRRTADKRTAYLANLRKGK
ncbi:50S ribosomal protein L17 [Phycisphaerae bacterium]|jgi:large subunit ribosomal protein L17|nr:50S ribosomal protein L17 [Phycisphaerae bacterium]